MSPLIEPVRETDAFRRAGAAQHAAGLRLPPALRAHPQRRDRARAAHHHPVPRRRLRRQRDAGARGVAAIDRGAGADRHLQPLDRHSAADGRAACRSAARAARGRVASRRLGDAQHRRGRNRRARDRASARWRRRRAIGDNKQYLRGNRAFHFTIYQAARSDALLAIIETLWLQISPYFHLLHASGNYFKANEQHELMLSAMRARDEAAVSLGRAQRHRGGLSRACPAAGMLRRARDR